MNAYVKQNQTQQIQKTNLWLPKKGSGEGQIRGMQLADTIYYI